MAAPAIAAAASRVGSRIASDNNDGGGGKPSITPKSIAKGIENIRASNPNKGLFSDRGLKQGLTIGRYARLGTDAKGRETVNLGTFGKDAREYAAKK